VTDYAIGIIMSRTGWPVWDIRGSPWPGHPAEWCGLLRRFAGCFKAVHAVFHPVVPALDWPCCPGRPAPTR
jgi:hypothetical protein